MKRVNATLTIVFVSLFSLSSCGGDDDVMDMVIDQPGTEKMQADDHVHDSDVWD